MCLGPASRKGSTLQEVLESVDTGRCIGFRRDSAGFRAQILIERLDSTVTMYGYILLYTCYVEAKTLNVQPIGSGVGVMGVAGFRVVV